MRGFFLLIQLRRLALPLLLLVGLLLSKDGDAALRVAAPYAAASATLAVSGTLDISHSELTRPPIIVGWEQGSTSDWLGLVQANGSDGATSITDTGLSSTSHTWSLGGNAALTTAEKKFGSAAIAFDGSGDYAQMAASADMSFSGDFTQEVWLRSNSWSGYRMLWNTSAVDEFQVIVSDTGAIQFYVSGGLVAGSSTSIMTTGVWQHVALTRCGSTAKLWVDGTVVATGTLSGTTGSATHSWAWGLRTGDGWGSFSGQMDQIAFVKSCKYSSTFTPASTAYPDAESVKAALAPGVDFSAATYSSYTRITALRSLSSAVFRLIY